MRLFWLIVAVNLILPSVASARSESEFAYPFSQVWTIAVRLLRIDLNCPINEKDKEEGYFFFEYRDGKRSFTGSTEIIPKMIDGVKGVRVVIQLSALPRYVERTILDRLARKLDEELGQPVTVNNIANKKPFEKRPDDSKTPPQKKSAPK
jgi:hypothetical protein